jgi:nitrite reductase (NO-forming)
MDRQPLNRQHFLKIAGLATGAVVSAEQVVSRLGVNPAPTAALRAHTGLESASGLHAAGSSKARSAAAGARPFTVFDARCPTPTSSPVKHVHFDSSDEVLYIDQGVPFQAWTFNGTVPGPVLVLNQGDDVKFSLTNKSTIPHSIDFHAALTAPSKNYTPIAIGQTRRFDWKAQHPGCFMYHCGAPLVLHHMCMGMYGATIVKSKSLRRVDREYVIVQSEFYVLDGALGADVTQTSISKAMAGVPDYVCFNGYANQYVDHPLTAKVGELVRLWVLNAGPSHFSAFHVIGTIFEAAYQDGNPANKMVGMQTVNVNPGGGIMVEFRLPEAGKYPFVTHSFVDATKGAVGALVATHS